LTPTLHLQICTRKPCPDTAGIGRTPAFGTVRGKALGFLAHATGDPGEIAVRRSTSRDMGSKRRKHPTDRLGPEFALEAGGCRRDARCVTKCTNADPGGQIMRSMYWYAVAPVVIVFGGLIFLTIPYLALAVLTIALGWAAVAVTRRLRRAITHRSQAASSASP
jgi:hypothetical protein